MAEFQLCERTNVGRVREHNEDNALTWQAPGGVETPLGIRAVAAVADGMGGHQRGEVASQLAIRSLQTVLCALEDRPSITSGGQMEDYLERTLAWINTEVHKLSDAAEQARPGTTLTCLLLRDDTFVIGHVGDSRCYLLRDGRIRLLTDDHTYVAEQIRARTMTEEQAQNSPFRGSLMRCIGVHAEVEFDVDTQDLADGDCFLLCSDGLSEYVSEQEIAATLGRFESLDDAADHLVQLALNRGGEDNVTVVIAQHGDASRRLTAPPPVGRASEAETQEIAVPVPVTNWDVPESLDPPPPGLTGARPTNLRTAEQERRRKMQRIATPFVILAAAALLGLLVGLFSDRGQDLPEATEVVAAPPGDEAAAGAETTPADPTAEPAEASATAGQPVPAPAPAPAPAPPTEVTVTVGAEDQGDDHHIIFSVEPATRAQAAAASDQYKIEVGEQPGSWKVRTRSAAQPQLESAVIVGAGGQEFPVNDDFQVVLEPGDYELKVSNRTLAKVVVAEP